MKRLGLALLTASLFVLLVTCADAITPASPAPNVFLPSNFLANMMDGNVLDEVAVVYYVKGEDNREIPLLAGCVRLKDNQPVAATGRDMFISFTKPESHPEGLLLLSAIPEEIVQKSLYVGRATVTDVIGETQFICAAEDVAGLWLNLADAARNDLGVPTLSLSGPLEIP